MRAVALLLVAAMPLSISVAARAEIVEIKWTGGEFLHAANVAPKKFLEICGKLEKGATVAWRFKGSAESDFNIHYHVGNDVQYPENRKSIASAEGTLAVTLEQDYCWMWTNRSMQPIAIEVGLKQLAKKASP